MATVVEDGTGLANATSLVALAGIRSFAEARGVELTDDDDELEILVTKSVDYMKSREAEYSGTRLTDTQSLPWPRTDQYIYGTLVEDGTVPQAAKDYQCQIILALDAGVELMPTHTNDNRPLKRQKTGPLEKEWFDARSSAYVTSIEAALGPLAYGSGRFGLTVVRI